ncbi:MAG: methylamine utilization protein MauG [Rhodobacteraceae bacterium]|nr:methylamine utilization protein MauG [Paracoccaceae bacterium]
MAGSLRSLPVVFSLIYSFANGALAEPAFDSLETLGEALYFDVNLSANRSQSCATCHDPSAGFVDPRETRVGRAVSLGDDGNSLGDRTAPTAAYAAFTPEFHQNAEGNWVGGMFWDGRETGLEGQAGGPPLNPIEMGMPDKQSIVQRLLEDEDYVASFQNIFGAEIFGETDQAYEAMTQAISAYERTEFFAPFDSKYDRFLKGEYQMTREEQLGMTLFFSEQFTNCNLCHQLKRSPTDPQETFTNYEYHNIGIPENLAVRTENGMASGTKDMGLLANPAVDDPMQAGKFKVPTLRNVAVTGPYMHNGVFMDLRTVVLFYNRFNTRAEARQINPETGVKFRSPEIPHTLAVKELTHGPALDDRRIDALVAFMKTLTDARYEDLLEND